ncbi:glycosyl transferase [Candidatus Desulfofervidus auxilii]|uniref:Glycosyl transferase n=1 Tax=Desulfofervidus auxilii TaxID=1621989 RepID=A0A7U4THR7_DESA2|nr:glycosyltransferase family 2 protein [Candidatus Desulfofervidus auxilii]AMM40510.1 glycosyl transferase [Candidatus Desulfofervidus auxilii]CAD7772660.1 Glycosyl transferase family 2 [Candidatus Methanoperedenaceae archaeon GB50]
MVEKVTLYIPTYNAEKTLRKCLESVFSQTYPLWEILLVDDGSSDNTVEIARQYNVKIIQHQENKGISVTRNTAISHSNGDFLAGVDSDVTLDPHWLEYIMENFSGNHVGGVGGRIIESNRNGVIGRWLLAHRNPDGGTKKRTVKALPSAAAVFRKKSLLEIGGYNDDKRYDHSDLDASMRIKIIGYELIYEPQALAYHYFSGKNWAVFDSKWKMRKDAYINIGLFNNQYGLARKIHISLSDSLQMIWDDFKNGGYDLLYLDLIGGLRTSLLDIKLFGEIHNQENPDFWETQLAILIGISGMIKEVSTTLSEAVFNDTYDILLDDRSESSSFHRFLDNDGQSVTTHIQKILPKADLSLVSTLLEYFRAFLEGIDLPMWQQIENSYHNLRV